ncbi:MAG: phosphate propanoyltransferase, partial [Firmicutes bacterium]|nr:phosphate propanoyltransferase [Bacillota bacterium]
MEGETLRRLVRAILARLAPFLAARPHPRPIPVGVSNRHVHLAAADLAALFGPGYALKPERPLSQPGQFAAAETVIVAGPKGCLEKVRVLGPVRRQSQVEIARTDAFSLGLSPPVRESGDLAGTPGVILIGPYGSVRLAEGLIIARRHIHMAPADAEEFGVADGESVHVLAGGERGLVFAEVLVRVKKDFALELHLDTDEANAAGVKNGDSAALLVPGSPGAAQDRRAPEEVAGRGRSSP